MNKISPELKLKWLTKYQSIVNSYMKHPNKDYLSDALYCLHDFDLHSKKTGASVVLDLTKYFKVSTQTCVGWFYKSDPISPALAKRILDWGLKYINEY